LRLKVIKRKFLAGGERTFDPKKTVKKPVAVVVTSEELLNKDAPAVVPTTNEISTDNTAGGNNPK
jgi:hypothetical protein